MLHRDTAVSICVSGLWRNFVRNVDKKANPCTTVNIFAADTLLDNRFILRLELWAMVALLYFPTKNAMKHSCVDKPRLDSCHAPAKSGGRNGSMSRDTNVYSVSLLRFTMSINLFKRYAASVLSVITCVLMANSNATSWKLIDAMFAPLARWEIYRNSATLIVPIYWTAFMWVGRCSLRTALWGAIVPQLILMLYPSTKIIIS